MVLPFFLCTLQSATISIPVGTYSLPEVARLLSTSERSIGVADSLHDRGLLISLQNRTPDEALKIVCQALDLKAVRSGTRAFRLAPDPDVAAREAQWRAGLLKILTARWGVQDSRFMKLVSLDRDQLRTAKRDLKGGRDPFSGDVQTQILMLEGGATAKAASLLGHSAAADFRDSLLTDLNQSDNATAHLEPELVAQVQQRMGQVSNPAVLLRKFARNPGNLTVLADIVATTPDKQWIQLPYPNATMVLGEPTGVGPHRLFDLICHPVPLFNIPGLGDEADSWRKATDASTKAQLEDPSLGDPVNIPANDRSLSGLVQHWAQGHKREVVMELAPIAESLSAGNANSASLAEVLTADQDWSLESDEGALVVRNRMAFLDRLYSGANGTLAVYIRNNPDRSVAGRPTLDAIDSFPDLPLADDLLSLLDVRYNQSGLRNDLFGDWGYHGLTNQLFFRPSAFLWPGVPEEVKEQIIKTTSDGHFQTPLSQLDPDALKAYAMTMTNPGSDDVRLRQLIAELRPSVMTVTWKRRKDGEIAVALSVGLPDELEGYDSTSMFQIKG